MKYLIFLFFPLSIFSSNLFSQCMYVPVPLPTRIHASSIIVKATLKDKTHTYKDESGNIYTLNIFKVEAYLKGNNSLNEVAIITSGGVLGNEAQITTPSFNAELNGTYVLMLDKEEETINDKIFAHANPSIRQYKLVADAQGTLKYSEGKYYDLLVETPLNELGLLNKFEAVTNQKATSPNGSLYLAKHYAPNTNLRTNAISSFSPNPIKAGTIVASERLTINGSGFLAVQGTGVVQFTNGDDGGATFITPLASDYISWSDAQIVVRVPSNAATGSFNVVNNAGTVFLSGSVLTVDYSHLHINSSFSAFSVNTSQRYYYRNLNTTGGYSFRYNSTSGFDTDLPAKRAFERAASNWRCGIGMNWDIAASFSTTTLAVNDNENVVMYDNTLPMGVVGVADSRFLAGATAGTCDLFNTVWWLKDIDVRFPSIPLVGYTWNYTTALPSGTEFDFESVATHELGHAAGLGHRLELGDVMHYAIANGTAVRNPAVEEIAGGLARMAYSTSATCFNPPLSGSPMTGISVGCILTFKWLNASGFLDANGNANLTWNANEHLAGLNFVIEKSNDGVNFSPLSNTVISNNKQLNYIANNIENGANYFRINYLNSNGQLVYSPIIKILSSIKKINIGSQPNFWQINSSATYLAKLYNGQGQLILSKNILIGNNVILNSQWPKGIYYIKIGDQNYKLIKQ